MTKRDDKIREVLADLDAIITRLENVVAEVMADVPPEQMPAATAGPAGEEPC